MKPVNRDSGSGQTSHSTPFCLQMLFWIPSTCILRNFRRQLRWTPFRNPSHEFRQPRDNSKCKQHREASGRMDWCTSTLAASDPYDRRQRLHSTINTSSRTLPNQLLCLYRHARRISTEQAADLRDPSSNYHAHSTPPTTTITTEQHL
jgi:hypothetical protein